MSKKSAYHIEFVEHTADVRMRVRADSLVNLFEASLRGMSRLLKSNGCSTTDLKPVERYNIKINHGDLTGLLIDFLSEALTISQVQKSVFCFFVPKVLNEHELHGEILGYHVDKFDEDIKAVTYHEADVIRVRPDLYETTIIFDI